MNKETKTLHMPVKATGIRTADDGQAFGQIEAYGAIFNNVDEGNDKILKGAFTRTIQNSKSRAKSRQTKYILPMLWQHDTHELIGGWYGLGEDGEGLKCQGEIALGTQRGKEYYELAKAGMTDSFSITYDIPQGGAKYDNKSGVRELSEIRLYSVDPVTFAMNDSTYLVAIKSAQVAQRKASMNPKTKDFLGHLQEEMCSDLMGDWQDLYVCALTCAVMDAITIGDTMESDISDAIDAFKTSVLTQWVAQAQEYDLPAYLQANAYVPGASTLQNGSGGGSSYMDWMSSRRTHDHKAGRAISATNSDKIQSSIDSLHDVATKAMADMKMHTKAVHTAADDLATILQGSEAAYGSDLGTPDDGQQEGKSATSSQRTRSTHGRSSSNEDTDTEDVTSALARIRSLRSVPND